jgi:ABC-type sugar transport system substrate-binding protein
MTIVMFCSPIPAGANPAIDTLLRAASGRLEDAGITLRILNDETILTPGHQYPSRAIDQAVDAHPDAIGFYVVDPTTGAEATARALEADIPVITIARPTFPVTASLNYPGFNQGVFMMQHLLDRLEPGARVGIIGGPNALTDAEAVAGLVFAAKRSGKCVLVNDPEDTRHCNLTDDRAGGREVGLRFLEEFGPLDGLVPYNDESLLGVLDAVEELGLDRPPLMVSRNGSPKAVTAVRAGLSAGSWDLDAPGVGVALAELFIRQLRDGNLDGDAAMAPAGRMITAANIDSWSPWEQRVKLGPLNLGIA